MKLRLKYILLFLFLVMLVNPATANVYPKNNQLVWKGYAWDVRTEYGEPGQNYFSSSGVYVDSAGRLHLQVFKKSGKWYCSEVDSRNKFKYGTFTCRFDSPVFQYNKNVVCGMFTYLNDREELDIELTKWGVASGNNIWYSVQPYNLNGHNKGYIGKGTGVGSTHTIEWMPTYVKFTSRDSSGKIISNFMYTGNAPKNPEYLIFNVWLQGASSQPIDFVVSDFKYTAKK
jgi:beta-glucanase (GH16 family)